MSAERLTPAQRSAALLKWVITGIAIAGSVAVAATGGWFQ